MTSLASRDTGSTARQADRRQWACRVVGGCVAAVAFGFYLPVSPWDAVAWLILIPLAFVAPVGTVAALLAITVLVPWNQQAEFKVIGGPEQPGVLFIDALMLLAFVRVGWQLRRRRLVFDTPLLVATIVVFICTSALMWGIANGGGLSEPGNEWRRVTLGVGTFILAWPLMSDSSSRRQLIAVLMAIGLVLGLWGIAQWVFGVTFTSTGDVGVRGGLGSKQLQGGLFDYPVAVVMAWTALISGQAKSLFAKYLLTAILVVNVVCVFLTFERTLLMATIVCCIAVVCLYGSKAGFRAAKAGAVGLTLLVVAAVVLQAEASTVTGRLALLSDPNSDNSYVHRVVETQVLTKQIVARPITGSGFGANVTWGVRDLYPESTTPFADMGYHWLFWKIGIPAASLIVFVLVRAVLRRTPAGDSAQWRAVRTGSRGALLALLIIAVLFGVFDALAITGVMGLLVAICYSRPLQSTGHAAPSDTDAAGSAGATKHVPAQSERPL